MLEGWFRIIGVRFEPAGGFPFLTPSFLIPFVLSRNTLFRFLVYGVVCGGLYLSLGCGLSSGYYRSVEKSLLAGNPEEADRIVANAQDKYGEKSRLLYLMDRGMTLHLAGHYQESNDILEQADQLVEDLYTRRIRDTAASLLVNDSFTPFEGTPYEQVMINVVKAVNYAMLGELDEALVEARKIDHRLNVLTDRVEPDDYHDDPFARYWSGILYEATGDLNNALISYQKAYDNYQQARPWLHLDVPECLKEDLLRVTDALHLHQDYSAYRESFSEISRHPLQNRNQLAQLIVLGFTGNAPRLEDKFYDVPVSLSALNLVIQTKALTHVTHQQGYPIESLLYGLNGHIVRVALPQLVPQKSRVSFVNITAKGQGMSEQTGQTHLVHNLTATAEKNLSDRMAGITVKAVARAVLKMGTADAIGMGVGGTVHDKNTGMIVRLLVSALLRIFAIATEEADKRSWRTLPDEIHLARMWVEPGTYSVWLEPVDHHGNHEGHPVRHTVSLEPGRVYFLTDWIGF